MDLLNKTLKELGEPVGVSKFLIIFSFFKMEILYLVAGLPEMGTMPSLI
jgi:hypothetical protein